MKKFIVLFIAIIAVLTGGTAGHAAGILTPVQSRHQPIKIQDHHVNVVINNGFAMTEVHQTFFNPNSEDLEAIYSFPVPKSASLSEVTIYAGENEINGEVIEKQKAEKIYEEEKSQGNDAGLAEKNEFYTFEFRVYPVPANNETKIRFLYYQPLKIDTGVGRYLYPLEDGGTDEAGKRFWTSNERVEKTFSVNLELKSAYPVKDVRVPGFEAAAGIDKLDDGHYKVNMALTDMSLNRDFIFYYRLAESLPGRVEVIPFRDKKDAAGTFMMVITPGEDLKPITSGSDYCFVLDISGSMDSKIHTLKKGVIKAIADLKAGDRFRIITFGSNAKELTNGWMPVSKKSMTKAEQIIKAIKVNGSTNMYAGMKLGLKHLDADRPANLVLITDAVTNTGVIKPAKFDELLKQYDVRVFGFLMGNSANWPLMQTIAQATGGYYDTISNADDIMGKLLQAGEKIKYEALLDASAALKGVKTFNLTDDTFKKVYRGEQLVIFGKYETGGKSRLTLRANLTGEDKTYTTDFLFPDIDTDNPELERLWALATIEKIEALERIGKMPASESENAIRDLGVDYQIVTDYTSMLVLSDKDFNEHGIDRRNKERIAREMQARTARSSQPVQNYTVDQQKPAFKHHTPSIGGGGGAVDPFTGCLAALGSIIGVFRVTRRKKKQ